MKTSSSDAQAEHSRAFRSLLFSSVLVFLCNISFAQIDAVNFPSTKFKASKSDDGATIICIQASIDFANIHESYSGVPAGYYSGYSRKVGFNGGVFAVHSFLPIGPGQVGAMAGLEFIQKGGTYGSGDGKENWRLNYIELPIDALYQLPVMDNSTVFAGFGPYFAYGIGGKIKYYDGTPSANAFGGDNGFKHFDFGLQFIAGFRYSGMASISLSYDLGLLSASGSSYSDQFKDKNGVISINLAYCLGGH